MELKKPSRDPRPEFKTALFKDGVEKISDLTVGMILEGVVTNVAAFVDVGVHQDGLVHISQLADVFVKDPRKVVKSCDVVGVKVQEIDLPRMHISLTMKMGEVLTRSIGKEKHEKKQNLRSNHQDWPKQKNQIKACGPSDVSSLNAFVEAFNKTRK